MSSKSRPKNVQHGFKSTYYFSRCFGLWPFTIAYNSNGSIIIEACLYQFDCLWFLISICVYLIALYYTYDHIKTEQLKSSENYFFSHLIYNLIQIPPLLLGVIGIVLDMFNRKRLVNIFEKSIIFDREVYDFVFRRKKIIDRVTQWECTVRTGFISLIKCIHLRIFFLYFAFMLFKSTLQAFVD